MEKVEPSGNVSERPSMASRKCELRHSTWNASSELSAIIIGRTLRLCGATAVSENTLVPGTIIGPPLDKEYAVLPVGVLMMRPSA